MFVKNDALFKFNTNNHYNQSFQGSSDSNLLDFMNKIALKPKLPDVDKFEKITRIKKNILTIENYNEVTKKAHPDFYEISQYNLSLRASSFFRRGVVLGETSYFKDVIDVFSTLFNKNTNDKKSILIVGIGRSQEPFSYLASIKELIKDKKLKDVLNLQTVDLQAKPTKNILLSCTHYGGFWGKEPIFAKSSFIKYAQMYGDTVLQTGFRVNDEIFDYLYKTYNNKSKSKWATRIQDDIKNYPDNSFDVLSMNNVLGYIEDDDEYYSTIKNMPRIVKPNGFIITDTICENLFQKVGVDKMLTKISAGIFKKSNN
ncbi:unknown [Clostridium sp. CAG:715]|nr:unknown [Clostridium sp. CAG:715]